MPYSDGHNGTSRDRKEIEMVSIFAVMAALAITGMVVAILGATLGSIG